MLLIHNVIHLMLLLFCELILITITAIALLIALVIISQKNKQ